MTIALADRNLEEQVFQLQRLDLEPAVRQVVDEAAQLLAEGRHLEAGALVEKAEALRLSAGGETQAGAETAIPSRSAPAVARLASELATGIADGIAKVLAQSIQGLEEHIVGETRKSNSSFSQKLEKLQETVESLLPLKERIERLGETISEQSSARQGLEQRYELLTTATAALEAGSHRQDTEITALRGQTQELATSVSGVSTRLDSQQEQLSSLSSTVVDLSPRIANLTERLDRQGEAIRSLYDGQTQREAALDQVVEAVTRLKLSRSPALPEGNL